MLQRAKSTAGKVAGKALDVASLGYEKAMSSEHLEKVKTEAAGQKEALLTALKPLLDQCDPQFRDFVLDPSLEKLKAHPEWLLGAFSLLAAVKHPVSFLFSALMGGNAVVNALKGAATANGGAQAAGAAPGAAAAAGPPAGGSGKQVLTEGLAKQMGLPPQCVGFAANNVNPADAMKLLGLAQPLMKAYK